MSELLIPLTTEMDQDKIQQIELFKERFEELWANWESLKKLGIEIQLNKLYLACKEELQWQRKEDYSINLLFQNVDVQDIQGTGFDFIENNTDHIKYRANVAEYIYKVRNSLVHQSDRAGKPFGFDESHWLILIELVLLVTLKNSELLIVGEK